MLPFHLDPNVVIGIAGGIIGAAGVYRTANLNVLKTELESLRLQVGNLTARCTLIETERDMARREIVSHYTARTEIAEENRELHKEIAKRDEKIIFLQRDVIEAQKNTLRCV